MFTANYSIPPLTDRQIKNFNAKILRPDKPDGCWIWTGGMTNRNRSNPYGAVEIAGIVFRAHRIAYFLGYGQDPLDKSVLHQCDTPLCVNPKHLFLGTQADNVHDAIKKDRFPRGSRSGCSKLSEDQVREVRAMLSEGVSLYIIAARVNATYACIWDIKSGRSWKHLQ